MAWLACWREGNSGPGEAINPEKRGYEHPTTLPCPLQVSHVSPGPAGSWGTTWDCVNFSGSGLHFPRKCSIFSNGPRIALLPVRYSMNGPAVGRVHGKERHHAPAHLVGNPSSVVRLPERCWTFSRPLSRARGRPRSDHPGTGKPRPGPLRFAGQVTPGRTAVRLDATAGSVRLGASFANGITQAESFLLFHARIRRRFNHFPGDLSLDGSGHGVASFFSFSRSAIF